MRTPDHGKLEPWRFIVLEKGAMSRLANLAETRAAALGLDSNATFKGKDQYAKGNLAVVVVESLQENEKIPDIEQTYSAGAVCLALLNAALASGWGANWLSGWTSHDREFVKVGFGLDENERVAGIIHIGTEGFEPPERTRPNPEEKITWQSE
jgi:nitroreductase